MANWYYGLHHHDQKVAAVLVSLQGHQEGSRCTSFTARGRKLGTWYCKGQKAGYAVLQGAESRVHSTARGRKPVMAHKELGVGLELTTLA